MQTVQFQCGGCNKLMAVGVEYVGRQVRCPHCQQVVVAPAAGPGAAPAEPAAASGPPGWGAQFPQSPAVADADSIFAPPNVHSDDLFGDDPSPRLELPPQPAPAAAPPDFGSLAPTWAAPAPAASAPPADLFSPPASYEASPPPGAAESPTFTYAPAPVPGDATVPLTPSAAEASAPWLSATTSEAAASDGASPDLAAAPAATPRAARRPASNSDWMVPLAILPLFGLLASIGLNFWLIFWEMPRRARVTYDRIEALPDVGDSPGTHRKLNSALDTSDERLAYARLPERLITRLGEPLRVGDLEVTPKSVELRVVRVFVEGSDKPEPCEGPSLVLNLRLRNMARDYAFTPLDNYFDRHYQQGLQVPLTQLEIGRERLFGGPARWYPRYRDSRDRNYREWVEGRRNHDDRGLMPGEPQDTLVCTDWKKFDRNNPDEPKLVADLVARYKGTYTWRLHVRRGLIRFQDLEKSATAVIGVRFTEKDIERKS